MFHVKHSFRRSIRCGDFFSKRTKIVPRGTSVRKNSPFRRRFTLNRPERPFSAPWVMFHVKQRFFGTFLNTPQSLAAQEINSRFN
jgi:hypothetical protein